MKSSFPTEKDAIYQKFDRAIEKFNQEPSEEWRSYFLGAARRIESWLFSISTNENIDSCIKKIEGTSPQHPEWTTLLSSVNYLLEAALNIHDTEIVNKLVDINNLFLSGPKGISDDQRDKTILLKDMYRLHRTDIYGFVAAMALFDFHLSQCEHSRSKNPRQLLELIALTFNDVAEGFGLRSLSRRWNRVFVQLNEPDHYSKFLNRLEKAQQSWQKIALELNNRFKIAFPDGELYINQDPRGPLWEYQAGYYDVDVTNVFPLQITCSNVSDCYLALGWVESLGQVHHHLFRSSLSHPEHNGVRRLQTAVRLPEWDVLVLARIGTIETHKNNEWGLIYKLVTADFPLLEGYEAQKLLPKEMVVYDSNGKSVILDVGSTVGDFILKFYSVDDAQYFSEATINGIKARIEDLLVAEDVIRISIDHRHIERTLPENWYGQHASVAAKQLPKTIEQRNQEIIDRGRNKLLLTIQNYLRAWGVSLMEKDLQYVLGVAGFKTEQERNRLYQQLAEDRTIISDSLCQLFLQYYLRGKIVLSDGSQIPFHWKNIKLAQCCNPKESDMVIGNHLRGPHNPDDPRFGKIREQLLIHKVECKNLPLPRNRIDLVWARKAKVQYRQAIQISYLLPDTRGLLGETLNYMYHNTSLAIHYLTADAVNFGQGKAQIVLLASAPTVYEIEEAKEQLHSRYGANKISFRDLDMRDAINLIPDPAFCPYILTSDPHMYDDAPLLMVGRTHEINKLKSFVNDRRINQAMIVGYYRTGKTWFLKHFKSSYNLPNHFSLYISFDRAPLTKSPAELPQELYRQIRSQLANYGVESSEQRPNSIPKLGEWLNKTAQENSCRFTLLVDEFSGIDLWVKTGELDKNFVNHFIRFMDETKSTSFVLVFQAAQFYNLLTEYTGMIEYFRARVGEETIEIKPFSNLEIFELLNYPVKQDYQVTSEAVNVVHALTGGFPILCTRLGRTLWSNRSAIEEVNLQILKQLWNVSLEESIEDWSSILGRMIEKFPQQLKSLLGFISTAEFENVQNIWQNPGNLWVSEAKVLSYLRAKFHHSYAHSTNILNNLRISSVLEIQRRDNLNYWRLRSDLLAWKLSSLV